MLSILMVKNGIESFYIQSKMNKQFKIIAGPCAVESEGQIMAIAKGIADIVQKSSNQSSWWNLEAANKT